MKRFALCAAACLAACGFGQPSEDGDLANTNPRGFEPPVVMNAESPVEYPLALYEREIGGTVVLRLFVSEQGTVVPESTRIAESSGEPRLDSAAVAGVAAMEFAPARQDGQPVATLFLQPVRFEHPSALTQGDRS